MGCEGRLRAANSSCPGGSSCWCSGWGGFVVVAIGVAGGGDGGVVVVVVSGGGNTRRCGGCGGRLGGRTREGFI